MTARVWRNDATCLLAIGVSVFGVSSAFSQGKLPLQDYEIPSETLSSALTSIVAQSKQQLIVESKLLEGKRSVAVTGRMTEEEALARALVGSGLAARVDDGLVTVRVQAPPPPSDPHSETIIVTGSRIRGGPVASPVVELSQATIEASGKTNLGDAVRTLPQNFSGGQNPGVGGGGDQGGTNQNIGSASTINLRGLGPDATLTLINGHRVAYDSYVQGVDVDSIPLAALDRIEIVPDGASALYGSDAVGGVANILLKRDYDGLSLSARYGGATDGGNAQTEMSAVAGTRWSTGGIIATFDFSHSSPITAAERSYTQTLSADQTLFPGKTQYSGVVSGHQTIGAFDFSIDGLFNRRRSDLVTSFTPPADHLVSGANDPSIETSYSVSPRAAFPIGPLWKAYVTGTYGHDDTSLLTDNFANSSIVQSGTVHYDNSVRSAESGVEGPLFSILSQSVRLAAGIGYRSNGLDVSSTSSTGAPAQTFARRSSYYVYGELAVPLVSPTMAIPAVYRLAATAALRYERYRGEAGLATPKLGLIYSPIQSLELKASWGKSFKTPTLYEQLQANDAVVLPASFLASGLPSTANALLVSGGSRDLKPEKATSWTITAELKPAPVAGLDLQFSYFHTRYVDRVVQPIDNFAGIFTSSLYADLLTYGPSTALQQQIIATLPVGLRNLTGEAYDPGTVTVLIDDRNRNAARQLIQGVDGSASYRLPLGGSQSITANGSASYLKSRQQLGVGEDLVALSGTIFNPPHWRATGGLIWDSAVASVAANVNYIGAVTDNRYAEPIRVRGMVPVDLTAHYQLNSGRSFADGVGLTLTVQNILNTKPAVIGTFSPYDPPYDSTNDSVVGRFVSFTITKKL